MSVVNALAVGGTLVGSISGAVVTGVIQARLSRAARRDSAMADRQRDALKSVSTFVSAVHAHRRAMWVLRRAELADVVDQAAVDEARAISHQTREAITEPLTTVCILAPRLADLAVAAEQASYALHHTDDLGELEPLRQAARDACDALVAAAAAEFKALNAVV